MKKLVAAIMAGLFLSASLLMAEAAPTPTGSQITSTQTQTTAPVKKAKKAKKTKKAKKAKKAETATPATPATK